MRYTQCDRSFEMKSSMFVFFSDVSYMYANEKYTIYDRFEK